MNSAYAQALEEVNDMVEYIAYEITEIMVSIVCVAFTCIVTITDMVKLIIKLIWTLNDIIRYKHAYIIIPKSWFTWLLI